MLLNRNFASFSSLTVLLIFRLLVAPLAALSINSCSSQLFGSLLVDCVPSKAAPAQAISSASEQRGNLLKLHQWEAEVSASAPLSRVLSSTAWATDELIASGTNLCSILPCNLALMYGYISGKITEQCFLLTVFFA